MNPTIPILVYSGRLCYLIQPKFLINAIIAVFVCTRKRRYSYPICGIRYGKGNLCAPLSISRCLAKNRKTLYIDCSQWLFEILWIWIVAKRPLMYYLCTGFWENKSTETALSYVYLTYVSGWRLLWITNYYCLRWVRYWVQKKLTSNYTLINVPP